MMIGTTVKAAASGILPGRALLGIHRLADEQPRRTDDLRDDIVAKRQRET